MEWIERLNDALDYVEENLEGEIRYEQAAKLACCSTYHFQRMFSYIAGVPLSEYIRRRRMTAAAFVLQNGGRVLDTALRFGYESPTSFNRAFQAVHGITPSSAQKEGAQLKAFPRISFQLSIKGGTEMDYKIVKKEAFQIMGAKTKLQKDVEANFQAVPSFWQKAAQEGVLAKLAGMISREPLGVLGVSACMGNEEEWAYYIAVAADGTAPEGMATYQVPAGTWAVFSGQGPMPQTVQETEKRIVTQWLPVSGYEYADAPDIEVYLDDSTENGKFEVWVPVVKKD